MLPRLVKIRQNVPACEISDIRQAVINAAHDIGLGKMDLRGLSVGITAGSRGIYGYAEIMKTVIDMIKESGGYPVIIPAMGTHGGASPEGQKMVLDSLGINESTMGVPIRASIDTVQLGTTPEGIPVFCNVEATKVDRLILLNRIKQHTDFSGELESGVHKIMTIGLGSYHGASIAHFHCMALGYERAIISMAVEMKKHLPLIFAIGILENWKGKTEEIVAMFPEEMMENEKALLKKNKSSTIKLPFDQIDILLVGEIGKDLSGGGMDSKVVGRIRLLGQKEPETPKISRIVVLGISPGSHGNAMGLGLADFTTRRVFESIDFDATVVNCVISMAPEYACIPCVLKNDIEAVQAALRTIGTVDPEHARVVYIKNTSELEEILVSEELLKEVEKNDYLEVTGCLSELKFDHEGKLCIEEMF